MKPTKIICEPIFDKTESKRGSWIVKCDDGEWYTFLELAEKMGVAPGTYYSRFQRHGWPGMGKSLKLQKCGKKSSI